MTQEEKQLLFKDLCARLPYGVWMTNGFDTYRLTSPFLYEYMEMELKPYLRPMSSMTEEEEIYYSTVYTTLKFYEKEDWLNTHYFDYRGLIPMGLALESPEGMYKNE